MGANTAYVGGMIAAKEGSLLGDRIYRMCELSLSEAFRMLVESGFGAKETASSVYEYEKLISADEADIDAFIREYSPRRAVSEYLLSWRDFHNAKAVMKAARAGEPAEPLLSPEGMIPVEKIERAAAEGVFDGIPERLKGAMEEAALYLSGEEAYGDKVGIIFDRAYYEHLLCACRRERLLKRFVSKKADMQNALTMLRYGDAEKAEGALVSGGKLSPEELSDMLFGKNAGKKKNLRFADGFLESSLWAAERGTPFSDAEKIMASFEERVFYEKRYELRASEPFLYYIMKRRAENENVRIVFVCLLNGFKEEEIKARLRSFS
ncbi:MAG: V-type ATPase subunit [Clostridia bacterium]|nr:V-type ATPase subunit [Clostridia bacterium]